MGREVRRVPAGWQHPTDSNGNLLHLHNYFPYNEEEIAEGLRDGWLQNVPPHYGCAVMPDWPEAERTHWQMYEDTTEGTPISPVMGSPETLAQWLVDHHASAFASQQATYDQWLATILRGSAISAVWDGTIMKSGVAYEADHEQP